MGPNKHASTAELSGLARRFGVIDSTCNARHQRTPEHPPLALMRATGTGAIEVPVLPTLDAPGGLDGTPKACTGTGRCSGWPATIVQSAWCPASNGAHPGRQGKVISVDCGRLVSVMRGGRVAIYPGRIEDSVLRLPCPTIRSLYLGFSPQFMGFSAGPENSSGRQGRNWDRRLDKKPSIP